MNASECLSRLRDMYPNEFCRVMEFTEYFPDSGETSYSATIQLGFVRNVRKFEGDTIGQAMAQVPIPYEDQTCGECHYGAIDYSGLCVIDATHNAVPAQ